MEYALWALGIFLMFSLIAVILYVSWIVRYGVEEYVAGRISIRRKGVDLDRYHNEVRMVLSACRGSAFMRRPLEPAEAILGQTCIVLTESLYAGKQKCIGLASRVQFMNLPGAAMKRYLIWLDLGSIRSKSLSYDQIESLIRHEFTHHATEVQTGSPDPLHSNKIWSQIT